MANKISIRNGVAVGVYDDRLLPIYKALGSKLVVERASNVEFHSRAQWWVAYSAKTGGVIACGPNRSDVINEEIEYLERGL
jgi:hypothetical protein